MKVIVLGSGKIGSVIAQDFSKKYPDITMSDINIDRAKKAAKIIQGRAITLDTSKHQTMVKTLKEYDLVLSALPGDYGYAALKACIEAKKNVIDVSFTPENPTLLDKDANNAGISIIPDCGVAPGLSNLCARAS